MTEKEAVGQIKPKNTFVAVLITQSICVVMIILSVLTVKFFFKAEHKKLAEWYEKNVAAGISAEDVLNKVGSDEI